MRYLSILSLYYLFLASEVLSEEKVLLKYVALDWYQNGHTSDLSIHIPLIKPFHKQFQWISWSGTDKQPILVLDPWHKGTVHSGSQIVGSMMRNRTFSNGIEALKALDNNQDDALTRKELYPLGLWFDNNRDGKSQPGEVISARSAGLEYIGPLDSPRDMSFTRKGGISGSVTSLTSVSFRDKDSALEYLSTQKCVKSTSNVVDGIWKWKITTSSISDEAAGSHGFFLFNQFPGELKGTSMIEVTPRQERGSSLKSVIHSFPISGAVEESTTITKYNFSIAVSDSNITDSEMYLNNCGTMLIGRSSFTRSERGSNKVTYDWIGLRKKPTQLK